MISFKKYTDVVGGIAKKLKVSKDVAVNALIKAQEKGMNPLKWQQNITMLQSYIQIAAEYESVNERVMSTSQKVTQMNYYWKDLDHMASDERKKKNMQTRFGIKNIKLDKKGNILSFESVEEEVDAHVKVMIKRGDSAEVIKKMHPEIFQLHCLAGPLLFQKFFQMFLWFSNNLFRILQRLQKRIRQLSCSTRTKRT